MLPDIKKFRNEIKTLKYKNDNFEDVRDEDIISDFNKIYQNKSELENNEKEFLNNKIQSKSNIEVNSYLKAFKLIMVFILSKQPPLAESDIIIEKIENNNNNILNEENMKIIMKILDNEKKKSKTSNVGDNTGKGEGKKEEDKNNLGGGVDIVDEMNEGELDENQINIEINNSNLIVEKLIPIYRYIEEKK